MATSHLEAIPFAQAMDIIYESYLLSSVMIDQTIIQAALSSIENVDGTKSTFEAWTVHRKCSTNIWSGHTMYNIPQSDRFSTFIS